MSRLANPSPHQLEELVRKAKGASHPPVDEVLGEIVSTNTRRFAVAIGDNNPIFHQVAVARTAGYADLLAPPTFVTSVVSWQAGPESQELRADGAMADPFLGAVFPGLRLMGAGQSIRFIESPVAGMQLRRRTAFLDATLKHGRSGSFALVAVQRTFDDERTGQRVIDCREEYIVR
jgi:hypothetical protein